MFGLAGIVGYDIKVIVLLMKKNQTNSLYSNCVQQKILSPEYQSKPWNERNIHKSSDRVLRWLYRELFKQKQENLIYTAQRIRTEFFFWR